MKKSLPKGLSALSVASQVCVALGTPYALSTYLLIQHGEWEQLATRSFPRAEQYTDVRRFKDDYLAWNIVRKYADFAKAGYGDLGKLAPEKTALSKFFESERLCAQTNERFYRCERGEAFEKVLSSPMDRIFRAAKDKIAFVLGPVGVGIQRSLELAHFGPGVSSSCKGDWTARYSKYKAKLQATDDLIAAGVHRFISEHHPWASAVVQADGISVRDGGLTPAVSALHDSIESVKGNAVRFVPKDAKTLRVICVEPHLNVFLQLGVGTYLKQRLLLAAGVNLFDQTLNQRLARIGSQVGSVATIDLSSASDTIAHGLVYCLLPYEWWSFLNTLRSKEGEVDGSWIRYQKFSSMGNGFTFELESLIFWALASAACELDEGREARRAMRSNISVYGDDLIVPTTKFALVKDTLTTAGFVLNAEKSYCDGPFRESCGKDYYSGVDVRPFFFKEEFADVRDVYVAYNQIVSYSLVGWDGKTALARDVRFRPVLKWIERQLPKRLQLRVPFGITSGGLASNLNETDYFGSVQSGTKPTVSRLRYQLEGYSFLSMLSYARKRDVSSVGAALMHSFTTESGIERTGNGWLYETAKRDTVAKVRLVTVRHWPDLGPWL